MTASPRFPAPIGIGCDPLDPPAEVLAMARAAEDEGFGSFWIVDSPLLWREAHVLMALAATSTDRIVIGTGVTNPVTRDPAVVASTYSTLDEVAPGRIAIGIGIGDSAVRLTGRRPATVAGFEQTLSQVVGLLEGREVDLGGVGAHLSFPRRVPVLVSATGPRALRLAARAADGVLLGFLTQPDQIVAARRVIEEEAERCGRDLAGFAFVAWVPCSVDHDGEAARRAVRVHVARHLLHAVATPPDVDPALVTALREAYEYGEHMHPEARHAELVPTGIVDRFTLVGTPDEVVGQAQRLLDTGVDHMVIVPRGDKRAVMRLFASDVEPRLAGAPGVAPA